jgi:hypothetical protein
MAHSLPRSNHSAGFPSPAHPQAARPEGDGCLGRTCMKWGADGELTDLDFQMILQRLGAVDAALGHELASGAEDPLLQQAG